MTIVDFSFVDVCIQRPTQANMCTNDSSSNLVSWCDVRRWSEILSSLEILAPRRSYLSEKSAVEADGYRPDTSAPMCRNLLTLHYLTNLHVGTRARRGLVHRVSVYVMRNTCTIVCTCTNWVQAKSLEYWETTLKRYMHRPNSVIVKHRYHNRRPRPSKEIAYPTPIPQPSH